MGSFNQISLVSYQEKAFPGIRKLINFKLIFSAGFLIQHWGGLCMTVKPKTNRLFLSEACDRFELKSSKALRHLKSGKCVVPESTRDNSFFRLQSDCTASHFAQTAKHSLKHLETGKCFHPRGGKSLPVAGTPVVIYSGCDQTRLEFTFVPCKLLSCYLLSPAAVVQSYLRNSLGNVYMQVA